MLRAGAIAFITTIVFVPLVRYLCNHWGLFDPSGPLKIHSGEIPRLGGVAIAASIVTGVSFSRIIAARPVWPFLVALALIWAVGFTDDIRRVSATLRLAVQIGAGLMLWYGGWRLPWFPSTTINLLGVCLLTVGFVNAFNFLDGADGLCAGVTAIIAAGYAILPGVTLSALGQLVAWSLLGASVGFLFFNFPPADIFMGDSGSTVLGFCVGFLGFDFYRSNATNLNGAAELFPILIAALPLLDAILAVSRRLRSRRFLLRGDRRHFYDLLMRLGWSPRKVALMTYAISIALCGIAWLVLQFDYKNALLLTIASVGALLAAGVRLGSLRQNEKARANLDEYRPITSARG